MTPTLMTTPIDESTSSSGSIGLLRSLIALIQRGRSFMRRGENRAPWPPSNAERRRFGSFFGVQPEILALLILWGILVDFSLTLCFELSL